LTLFTKTEQASDMSAGAEASAFLETQLTEKIEAVDYPDLPCIAIAR